MYILYPVGLGVFILILLWVAFKFLVRTFPNEMKIFIKTDEIKSSELLAKKISKVDPAKAKQNNLKIKKFVKE
jgi:hypothetical protein